MTDKEFIKIVQPYSMTSKERILELFNSLEYVRHNNIEGDIVECGVWKGGNILGIIEYLSFHKIKTKTVWLYDTFSGMTKPEEDIDIDINNKQAKNLMNHENIKACASLSLVKSVLSQSSFDKNLIKYIQGDVSQTLTNQENLPDKISLLRLDTDWYRSTKDELMVLYPKLVKKGILIVDDYGHWKGSKKAVDEYFSNQEIQINKIDYTGIKIIKND